MCPRIHGAKSAGWVRHPSYDLLIRSAFRCSRDQYMPGPGSQGMLSPVHGAVANAPTRGAG